MIEVHLKFKLLPETLYLSVNILDRFLSKEKVKREKFQLLGVTAMFIASKFEEIYPPEIRDFVYITEKAYSKDEIARFEYKVLCALNFDLITVSPYRLLERYNFLCFGDEKSFFIAQYIIELVLIEYKLNLYIPSIKAAAALYISRKLLKIQPAWPKSLETTSGVSEPSLKNYAKELCNLIDLSQRISLKACTSKFALSKFMEVSKIFQSLIEKK
jgi:cyclin B